MAKYNIIPIFVPHMGCPNDCVFCNQRKISGTTDFDINNSIKEIEKYLDIYSYTNDIELAFYGGSFTMIDKNVQEELLSIGLKLKTENKISKIRVSTRPDGITEDTIKRLKKYTVDTVELGVQSLDKSVLIASKRNHTEEDLYKAYSLLRNNDFIIGLQQMIGLPNDTMEKSIDTALKIVNLRPDFVRIYPTLVIKDTELENMYYSGTYKPLSLDDAIEISSRLLLIYDQYNLPVIRLGLQSSKDLQPGSNVVAGPHHDAIGEMVRTHILTSIFILKIKSLNENSKIISSPQNISQLVGQKGMGKNKLLKHYGVKNLKMSYDKSMDSIITIEDTNQYIDLNEGKKTLSKEWIDVFKKY